MLLTPRLLASTRDLTLIARRIADGVGFGAHRSRAPGPGLEFTQYRPYQPGDDLRRLDWKLAARSNRFFIRESERESSVPLRLLVDSTGSMAYAEDGVSLLDAARMLAAGLALIADRQGDAIGLIAVSDAAAAMVPARREQAQLARVLHALERMQARGRWPAWNEIENAAATGGRGITVLLTDAAEEKDEIFAAIRRLAALGHEVIVVHLAGRTLLEFAWAGAVRFEELESGRTVDVDASLARDRARTATQQRFELFERAVRALSADYQRVLLDEPLDGALRGWLRLRTRRA
mgnify:CR=1 FL=1